MRIHGKPYRTIWLAPEDPKTVQIIDQRFLPHRFVVAHLKSLEDAWHAIRDMQVRGAGLIGATAGFAMYLAALESGDETMDTDLACAASYLKTSRPTARNLGWAVERVQRATAMADSPEDKREIARTTALAIADEDALFCRKIGEHGLALLKKISRVKKGKTVNILTHCNAGWLAFVDYGSATAPLYLAKEEGLDIHVWVDETRPWNQGAKLTAWELAQEGVKHTLITDNAGGHIMQTGQVDLVIVGTDRTTHTGDVANKIGTYLKALAAWDNEIPFYVALPSSTFDWNMDRGSEIPIEIRPQEEITQVEGVDETGKATSVFITGRETRAANYAFDITPARLITGLITERGIVAANKEDIHKLFPEKGK
ncbi:unnamed protein product [Cyprideis torosa]|uniref:Methylthioribose-1-phosphate isomerase n=1 Tax=Cyprideis torosa TaxID=163714 RepID=A0A7R8ZTB4_9CRUS|nr:unnamed protein product [Cyprideis torosa]CAG0907335.1 unnamed protein product [Cyprideis torosa]